ncbi:MAG: PHP domain protein [Pelotomaculum sp. PtaU1.Bin035]|nr:MAG: PHP domain protein [Pelotomaculum sp. PtaU1.Bin035]
MREWILDLHIHTILSPCGGDDMVPPLVLARAKELGIEVIAVTDHNSAENVQAFMIKGREMGVVVLPGMEVQTKEDVHMVCLFDTLEQVFAWQEIVYQHLPDLKNKKGSFGEQWVVNCEGNKVTEVERLLLMGADLSIDEVVKGVQDLGGLCIAAHIDRKVFSLLGNLGFIPVDLPIDGVELTPHLPRSQAQLNQLRERGIHHLVSSDAHWLDSIYPPQCFAFIEECTIKELKTALLKKDGRYIRTIR